MTAEQFRRSLLIEQYAYPVAEWHPTAGYRIAAAERVRLVEDAMWTEQNEATA